MDRGDDASYLDDTAFGWSKHLLVFVIPTWVVEGHSDWEVGYMVKPIVRIWEGSEVELGFGAPEHGTTEVYHGFRTCSDNLSFENIYGTSVRTYNLKLYFDVNN